jgi:2-polyprenyl-6-methoxyphenol hydroxylase-like FAD-dependent oxidoreductase
MLGRPGRLSAACSARLRTLRFPRSPGFDRLIQNTPMKPQKTDVLVTGAGPVGLTTALFLHDQGMRTVVADAKPRGVTHSYALALHPASLDLFESVGVAGDVMARALPVRTLAVYAGERRLVSLPVAPASARHPYLAVTGQDVLEAALVEALSRRGVHVLWNHRLARFTQDPDLVSIEVDELEERVIGYAAARFDWLVRRTHALDAKFLVGADGHESLVRRQLGIEFAEVGPADHFAVFEFQAGEGIPDEVCLVLHENGLGVLWPLPGGRARWSFLVDRSRCPDALREKDHEPVQIIGAGIYPALEEGFFHELLAERAPWFRAGIGRVYWRMLVRFERRLAARFGDGRTWLVGDAGHLTGPAGIQSMNVGLREARELARHLVRASGGDGVEQALSDYDAGRQAEWKALLGLTGAVEAGAGAPAAVTRTKDRLLACLPGSGDTLAALAGGLGLRWVR